MRDLDKFVQHVADLLVDQEITVEEFVQMLQDYYGKGDKWIIKGVHADG